MLPRTPTVEQIEKADTETEGAINKMIAAIEKAEKAIQEAKRLRAEASSFAEQSQLDEAIKSLRKAGAEIQTGVHSLLMTPENQTLASTISKELGTLLEKQNPNPIIHKAPSLHFTPLTGTEKKAKLQNALEKASQIRQEARTLAKTNIEGAIKKMVAAYEHVNWNTDYELINDDSYVTFLSKTGDEIGQLLSQRNTQAEKARNNTPPINLEKITVSTALEMPEDELVRIDALMRQEAIAILTNFANEKIRKIKQASNWHRTNNPDHGAKARHVAAMSHHLEMMRYHLQTHYFEGEDELYQQNVVFPNDPLGHKNWEKRQRDRFLFFSSPSVSTTPTVTAASEAKQTKETELANFPEQDLKHSIPTAPTSETAEQKLQKLREKTKSDYERLQKAKEHRTEILADREKQRTEFSREWENGSDNPDIQSHNESVANNFRA